MSTATDRPLEAPESYVVKKFRAIEDCPTAPKGHVFEATEGAGSVLISVGAAERIPDDKQASTPLGPPRGTYNRRDQRARE